MCYLIYLCGCIEGPLICTVINFLFQSILIWCVDNKLSVVCSFIKTFSCISSIVGMVFVENIFIPNCITGFNIFWSSCQGVGTSTKHTRKNYIYLGNLFIYLELSSWMVITYVSLPMFLRFTRIYIYIYINIISCI